MNKDKSKEKWISEKIAYLIKNEGKTKEQAAGQAYGMYNQLQAKKSALKELK